MMQRMWRRWVAGGALLCGLAMCPAQAAFELVALGSGGGLNGDNLNAYLIRHERDARYVALDAGTTRAGDRPGA